jgi:hypothetical protein
VPDKTTTTDVILAAGPTVVALAAIGSALWQQRRSFTHDRALADLGAARALLDDAAVALSHAAEAIIDRMYDIGVGSVSWEDAYNSLYFLRERIAVRFGNDHPVSTAVFEAFKGFSDVGERMRTLRGPPAWAIGREPEPPANDPLRGPWDAVIEANDDFIEARGRFVQAAIKTAGIRLP